MRKTMLENCHLNKAPHRILRVFNAGVDILNLQEKDAVYILENDDL